MPRAHETSPQHYAHKKRVYPVDEEGHCIFILFSINQKSSYRFKLIKHVDEAVEPLYSGVSNMNISGQQQQQRPSQPGGYNPAAPQQQDWNTQPKTFQRIFI